MNLWLKADGYSIAYINNLPTAGYAIQIVSTLTWAWISDAIGSRWPVIVLTCVPTIIGTIILWVWPAYNTAAMFVGWYMLFMETGAGPLFMSWISEIMTTAVEQRYLTIGIVEAVAFSFAAWVPIYLYPSSEAPYYPYAYPITFMLFCLEAVCALAIAGIQFLEKKGKNKHLIEVCDSAETLDIEPEVNKAELKRV